MIRVEGSRKRTRSVALSPPFSPDLETTTSWSSHPTPPSTFRSPTFYDPTLPLLQSNQASTKTPYVAYNCLLIPVVVGVWWFWTKRTARRVVQVFTGNRLGEDATVGACFDTTNDTRDGEYDGFQTWEEAVERDNIKPEARFVQWIKGSRHRAKRRMRSRAKRLLWRKATRDPRSSPILQSDSFMSDAESFHTDAMSSDVSFTSRDTYQSTTGRWELIHDMNSIEFTELGSGQAPGDIENGSSLQPNESSVVPGLAPGVIA